MKTFRLIGMVLIAFFMGVNFVACSEADDAPTNDPAYLSKAIKGKWVADGYDGFMIVDSNSCSGPSIELYKNEVDHKTGNVSYVLGYEIKNDILKISYQGQMYKRLRVHEITDGSIVWKDYSDDANDYSDSYGRYTLWTWKRYNK